MDDNNNTIINPVRLNPAQAAAYLGFPGERSLEPMRYEGTGPRFQVTGKRVFYLVADLDEWARSQPTFSNTAEAQVARMGR